MWLQVLPWALFAVAVCSIYWLWRENNNLATTQKAVELAQTEDFSKQEQRIEELTGIITTLKETTQYLQDDKEHWESEVHLLEGRLNDMTGEMKKQKGRAQSAHTSKGQILEKWAPFVEHDQIDPHWKAEDWCFLGQPIDYVVFDWHNDKESNMAEGKVVLLDVKAAQSQLTTKQRRIRDLIKAGQVEWREIRLD
jgi:predicted Holliday junction resolvase-like endonuclease